MDATHATHRTIDPSPVKRYSDFDLWLGAKTALLALGVVSPSQCHGASSLPFLLGKLEDLSHGDFMKALRHLDGDPDMREKNMKYILLTWYSHESKNRCKYRCNRHLRPPKLDRRIKQRKPAPPLELTLPPPAHGILYTDDEVMDIISKYPKGSKARGDVRRLMIKSGFVKSKSTFYRHVKSMEQRESIAEQPAAKAVNPRMLGLGYAGDYIRPNIRQNVKWKGQITLPLIAVSFQEMEQMTAINTSHLANIDICELIGNSDVVATREATAGGGYNAQDPSQYPRETNFPLLCNREKLSPLCYKLRTEKGDCGKRISRLYFSPSKFPPSADGERDTVVCGRLRNYIEQIAEKGNSPVICVGSKSINEKRFKCRRWYRRKQKPDSEQMYPWHPYNMHSCTFSFAVTWDRFGYYIPLLHNKDRPDNLGCAWHCCPGEQCNSSVYLYT